MARIPYVDPGDVPEEYHDLLDPANPYLTDERAREDETEADSWNTVSGMRSTHGVLGHNPELLDAFRRYARALWRETELSRRERELVIMSVANARESAYEWHQHAHIALQAGVTEEELLAIRRGEFDRFDPAEAALVEYVHRFVEETVDDEVHDGISAHVDESTLVGIDLLAGYYVSIDMMGRALDLDLEEPFVGWELESWR
jgi:alkylhydroperoxidase/carboxymuconolactone decarboxylase family protein YurZ